MSQRTKKISKSSIIAAGKTASQLEALTADLDREFVADRFGPLSAADREQWGRAKRKPGRPRIGKGAKVVSISIERSLLVRSDRAAKKLNVSRAKLIATGLVRVLADIEGSGPSKRAVAPRKRKPRRAA